MSGMQSTLCRQEERGPVALDLARVRWQLQGRGKNVNHDLDLALALARRHGLGPRIHHEHILGRTRQLYI